VCVYAYKSIAYAYKVVGHAIVTERHLGLVSRKVEKHWFRVVLCQHRHPIWRDHLILCTNTRLRNEVGDLKFGQFLALGTGKTLAFVFDDTGSMGPEIDAAKTRVKVGRLS